MAFIRKRGDIWYVYWRQNGKQRAKSLGTKRKSVAQDYLKEFEYRLAKKELGQETDIALDRLKEEYLEYSKSTKKQKTYERHDVPRTERFVTFLHDRGLETAAEIDQGTVEDYQRALLEEEELAPITVRHCMYSASGMLSFAVRRGYLSNNVVKNVEKVKAQKNPPRYLSFKEWAEVEKVAKQTVLWPLVATAYYAGLRNSELRFLTWPEIDFKRDVITIRNKPGFSLKNRQSRSIPMNQELKKILMPHREDEGYCFTRQNGEQYDRDSKLSRAFKRLVVKPCEVGNFSLHTLRHTFASHLVMKGVSIYKVSQWLGHKSVNTTMIYAHLAPQDDEINTL
jgi:integrase